MRHRQEEIREKGFSMMPRPVDDLTADGVDFSKMRVGLKTVEDAILDLNSYKKLNSRVASKDAILKALHNHSYSDLREASNLFYETSGIYSRLCKYIAYLYRYDWFVVPYVEDENVKEGKVLKDFSKILTYLEGSQIPKLCGQIALNVVRDGCFYGYVVETPEGFSMQELPVKYCRSRYSINGFPTVEFNMKYFDEQFSDLNYRLRVVQMFPKDFQKGYLAFKQGKLVGDYNGDTNGWYLLDPAAAVKFNCGGSDFPFLANAIPAIIDLNEAQGLDRQKMMQKLLKIIIQKLPLDKNGDLIFDVDEAADIHNNAVTMLRRAVGVDVMTTFADVEVADMSDRNTTTSKDDLEKVERTVFNEFGVSRNLFNSESNLALTNSILDDEASIRWLPLQFQAFFNKIIEKFNTKPKSYHFKFRMLETTIYNYKELSKMYKEQTQLGYSKMLPQIALGHTQSEILATANFENNILHLTEIMIPPLMSSTMSSQDILGTRNQSTQKQNQNNIEAGKNSETKEVGRPQKSDNEKSDKTIANKESM